MKLFIKNYLNDFLKIDSILAFTIAFILNLIIYKNIKKAVLFSCLFVIVFLFFLNLLF